MNKGNQTNNIDRLLDVEMNVTVRFGSTELPLNDVANFRSGSIIELNRTVDQPVELLVNNYPFARGEVVVIDGYYGVRITDIDAKVDSSGNLITDSNKSAETATPPDYQKAETPDKPNSPEKPAQNTAPPQTDQQKPKPAESKPEPTKPTDSQPEKPKPQDNKEV